MNAVVEARRAIPPLKDPELFRDRCYVDGQWIEADSASASRSTIRRGHDHRHVPSAARRRRGARSRRPRKRCPRGARSRGGASVVLRKWFDLMVAHADDLARC